MSQEIRGIDSNILCYALDPAFPEHKKAVAVLKGLSPQSRIALNPTVFHETYHTLVYKQKWTREETGFRLLSLLKQKGLVFVNQTKITSRNAIYLASKYELGGRDSLILSNYLFNDIGHMYTHDRSILNLGPIEMADRKLVMDDPVV